MRASQNKTTTTTTTNNEGRMCLQSHRRVMLNNMKNAMCRLSWEIRSYSISHPITRRCLACLKINAKKYIFNISFVCASPENKMKQKKGWVRGQASKRETIHFVNFSFYYLFYHAICQLIHFAPVLSGSRECMRMVLNHPV